MRDCNPEEVRRRREECMVELRKAKRVDRYLQKRGRRPLEPQVPESSYAQVIFDITASCPHLTLTPDMTPEQRFEHLAVTFRNSVDVAVDSDLLTLINAATNHAPSPVLVHILALAGIVPKLLRIIRERESAVAQKAAWTLVNLTFESDPDVYKALLEADGLAQLVQHISSSPEELADFCVWTLSNVAGDKDTPRLRDLVLQAGVLDALQALTDGLRTRSEALVRNVCWLLSNLAVDRKPLEPADAEKLCWTLQRCLQVDDVTALADCLKAVFSLTKSETEVVQTARTAGLLSTCYGLLSHAHESVRLEAVRVVGNFINNCPDCASGLLDTGLLDSLQTLLSDSAEVKTEALWLLSSLLTQLAHATQFAAHPVLKGVIREMCSAVSSIRQEAVVTVHNFTCARTPAAINAFIAANGVQCACENLTFPDSRVVDLVLSILTNVLQVATGDAAREARDLMEPSTLHLDQLLQHRNVRIRARVQAVYRLMDAQDQYAKEELPPPAVFTFS